MRDGEGVKHELEQHLSSIISGLDVFAAELAACSGGYVNVDVRAGRDAMQKLILALAGDGDDDFDQRGARD